MTLTHPNSPVASELISDMIPNIQENIAYLDSTAPKFAVVTFSTNLDKDDGYSYQTVTSVGFEPSLIIFNSVCEGVMPMKSFGVYGPSTGNSNSCFYRAQVNIGVGSDKFDTFWSSSLISSSSPFYSNMCIAFKERTNYGNALVWATVYTTNSDGFILQWQASSTGERISYYAYTVATCFK